MDSWLHLGVVWYWHITLTCFFFPFPASNKHHTQAHAISILAQAGPGTNGRGNTWWRSQPFLSSPLGLRWPSSELILLHFSFISFTMFLLQHVRLGSLSSWLLTSLPPQLVSTFLLIMVKHPQLVLDLILSMPYIFRCPFPKFQTPHFIHRGQQKLFHHSNAECRYSVWSKTSYISLYMDGVDWNLHSSISQNSTAGNSKWSEGKEWYWYW